MIWREQNWAWSKKDKLSKEYIFILRPGQQKLQAILSPLQYASNFHLID